MEVLGVESLRLLRHVQVLERSGAPADHPKLLGFPEGDYLKVPVERIFLSEAARIGVGTYAPHDVQIETASGDGYPGRAQL